MTTTSRNSNKGRCATSELQIINEIRVAQLAMDNQSNHRHQVERTDGADPQVSGLLTASRLEQFNRLFTRGETAFNGGQQDPANLTQFDPFTQAIKKFPFYTPFPIVEFAGSWLIYFS